MRATNKGDVVGRRLDWPGSRRTRASLRRIAPLHARARAKALAGLTSPVVAAEIGARVRAIGRRLARARRELARRGGRDPIGADAAPCVGAERAERHLAADAATRAVAVCPAPVRRAARAALLACSVEVLLRRARHAGLRRRGLHHGRLSWICLVSRRYGLRRGRRRAVIAGHGSVGLVAATRARERRPRDEQH